MTIPYSVSSFCVIIPTYNNAGTLRKVIENVRNYTHHIIVVNDGSTDSTRDIMQECDGLIFPIHVAINKGKGNALRLGFEQAIAQGYRYAITIDADGQHAASDIPLFLSAIDQTPDALLIGARHLTQENMPAKNSFANKFSNFWYALQTLQKLPDTQSGFRLYPLQLMRNTRLFCNRYELELEILVRLSWRLVPTKAVPISVYYAPAQERISHFRPFHDFFRISLLNTLMTIIAIFYFYPKYAIVHIFGRANSRNGKDLL